MAVEDWAVVPAELAAGRSPPSVRDLPQAIRDAVKAYNSDGIEFIFDHFDTFLSIILNDSKLEWSSINKGFDYLGRSCQQLTVHLEGVFKNKETDNAVREHLLESLKMYLYLFTGLMKSKDTKLSAELAATLSLGKRGRKANAGDDQISESEWRETERRAALDIIYNLLQLPLQRLWDPPLPDDTFVEMVAQPCYRMMEDTIIKSKTARETVFQILGVLNKKYNHGISCTIKLVQMVQLYEHAVSPICAGVHQLVTVWALTGLVARLVRELGETLGGNSGGNEGESAGPSGDSAPAQRNCAQFLSELTQLMPAQMIPAAQAMRCYLENDESYPLRSSVLGMLCEIICRELQGEGLSDEKRSMRDEFLDDLEEHLHDLSAYVRSKALQYWGRLQREGCVPITRLQKVLARAVGRLQDRATLVRKNAVQLVKVFLEHNPYSAQLKLAHLEEQLETEKKALGVLQKKLAVEPDSELLKTWEEIECEVKNSVLENFDMISQEDPKFDNDFEDTSHSAVKKFLEEKKYVDALMIIKFTEKQYPGAKLLRCEMEKDDQISYVVNILKNVFVTNAQDNIQSDPETLELIKKFEEKENIVGFLEDSVSFSKLIQQAVPLVYTLLMSKQATDVNEAIDFFITAHNFNIETAKLGTMGMLQLVWSPDQEKRDAVENAYRSIYLKNDGGVERNQAGFTAQALVKLVLSINRGQAAALQALLARWLQAGHLSNSFLQILWEMFTRKHEGTTEEDSYAALSLLVMISKAKASVASANIDIIRTVGLTGSYKMRVLSAQLFISMAQNQQRYPMDNPIFTSLSESLLDTFFNSKKFAALGVNCINVIFALCDTPDLMCMKILNEISDKIGMKLGDSENTDSEVVSYPVKYISRLLVLLGHIAMQQLIFLDVTVYAEFRRRNEIREQRKLAGTKNKIQLAGQKNGKSGKTAPLNSSSASAAGRRLHNQSWASSVQVTEDVDESEAGMEGAVADDADAELLRAVCEREVVGAGLLNRAAVILKSLLQCSTLPQEWYAASCLALGRFMLVSSTFCEDNMQLLMTLLKNASCSTLRCNIVITLADLTLRFPNVVQPWTPYIYERLEDDCVEVRQCTVKMLSYLILQEMVRVRGQVSGLAKCCVDEDPSTRTMARLFFKQLSQKGNALYNIMPDIISRLSDPSISLPEENFRIILKYVMSLIQKDRQMEALVEKLCLRFKLSTNERQWRDLAFCLSLFNYNERSIKKLIENLDCYKDKLFTKEVYDCFKTIINNTNKLAKADLKATVNELSDKIEENFSIQENNEDRTGSDDVPKPKASATPRPRKAGRGRRARAHSSSDESDENSDSDSENMTPRKNKKNTNARTPLKKRTPLKFKNGNHDSDGDDFEDNMTKNKNEVFKKPTGRIVRKRK